MTLFWKKKTLTGLHNNTEKTKNHIHEGGVANNLKLSAQS